jgi:predicted GH43/DUF377 family glycosyl hydrolase
MILPVFLALSTLAAWIDLESLKQDFVLETKQLVIEGYPDAFNPSIVRFQEDLLLTFRIYDPVTKIAHQIGIVELDDELNPKGPPKLLQFQSEDLGFLQKRQDPRPIVQGEELLVIYNNLQGIVRHHSVGREIRRMLVGKVLRKEGEYTVQDTGPLLHFEGESFIRPEKNWVPFIHQDELYLSRLIHPHQVFKPRLEYKGADLIAETTPPIDWQWGDLRGGTPALLVEDGYLAFFHSCKNMRTVHSQGKLVPHYFMGAYMFSAEPPFQLTKISTEPIIAPGFYHGKEYKTWKPLHVVFPGGFIINDQFIWIAYGRQDHEVWIVKLDKEKLLASMREISQ